MFILFRHYFLLDGPAHFFENTFENLLLNSDYLRKNTDDKVAWEKFWRTFSKKITLIFWLLDTPAHFYKYFFKNRPQIRFFRAKIRVGRWHGEGFDLFFQKCEHPTLKWRFSQIAENQSAISNISNIKISCISHKLKVSVENIR